MPTGAILYVQVPDSTTSEDWKRWREAFLESFDLEEWRDTFQEGVLDAIKQTVFELGESWELMFYTEERRFSFNEVFPADTFRSVHFPWYVHYNIGYERGDVLELIAHASWFEDNIPGSTIWYAVDSNCAGWVFNQRVREALLAYYHEVGHEPYRATREDQWRWVEARRRYLLVADREEELFLQRLRERDGISDYTLETAS